jgi:hypothetical protein
MGPGRGKGQHIHTIPQTEAKSNEHHRAPEGYSRYEEDVVRFESNVDAEIRKTSKNRTPPRASNANDCAVGGGK